MFSNYSTSIYFVAQLLVLLSYCSNGSNGADKIIRVALNKDTTYESGIANQPVTTYYTTILVGTPPKPFKVLLDVNAKESWLPHYLKLGIVYNRLHYSTGYNKKDSKSSVKEDKEYSIEYQKCYLTGKAYEDIVEFGNVTESFKTVSLRQRFLAISSASNDRFSKLNIDGVISLSSVVLSDTGTRSILVNLNQQGLINDLKFSFYFDTNPDTNYGGEITFGGLNPNKYLGNIYYHHLMNFDNDKWELKLQHVLLGSQLVSCHQKNCSAILSTGLNDLYGPLDDVRNIMNLLNVAKPINKLKKGDEAHDELYEIDCLRVVDLPNLTFNIDGMSYVVTPSMYVKKHVEGLVFKTSTCYVSILSSRSNSQWILGTNFLSSYYTVFDLNRRQVGISAKSR